MTRPLLALAALALLAACQPPGSMPGSMSGPMSGSMSGSMGAPMAADPAAAADAVTTEPIPGL